MRICSASRQWLFDGPSRPAHLGARIHLGFRHRDRSRWLFSSFVFLMLVALVSVWLPPVLTLDVETAQLFQNLSRLMLPLIWIQAAALVASAWFEHKRVWNKLLSPDLWVALFLVGPFFWPWPHHTSAWLEIDLGELSLRSLMGIGWVGLRILESYLWSRQCRGAFLDHGLMWDSLLVEPVLRCQRIRFGVVLVLGALVVGLDSSANAALLFYDSYFLAIACACIPTSLWLSTKLLLKAEREKWKVHDFQFFKDLRLNKLAIFQSFGVLSNGQARVTQVWIDESLEWPKEDIEEVLSKMGSSNDHPLSQALTKHFSHLGRDLLSLQMLETVPHLGLRAEFRDARGSRFSARLGSPSWHRVLQTEMSDDGRAQLKRVVHDGAQIGLLSLNQSIVALLVYEDRWRDDLVELSDGLKRQEIHHVILSSSSRTLHSLPYAAEVQTNLFPTERARQYGLWLERESKAFEVKAPWDGVESQLPCVEMSNGHLRETEQSRENVRIRIHADKASLVASITKASAQWHHALWKTGLVLVLLSATIYGSVVWTVGAGLLMTAHLGTLLWIQNLSLNARSL